MAGAENHDGRCGEAGWPVWRGGPPLLLETGRPRGLRLRCTGTSRYRGLRDAGGFAVPAIVTGLLLLLLHPGQTSDVGVASTLVSWVPME